MNQVWVLLIKSVSGKRIARVKSINHFAIKFQFIDYISVHCSFAWVLYS